MDMAMAYLGCSNTHSTRAQHCGYSDSVELAHTESLVHSQQQITVNGSLHLKSVAKATPTIQ